MMDGKSSQNNLSELDWITLREDVRQAAPLSEETPLMKVKRKFNENPFVPIGCIATSCVLTVGLWSMVKGNRKLSQNMMRLRVFVQGVTLVALLGGMAVTAFKK